MTGHRTAFLSLASIDGIFALAITCVCLTPTSELLANFSARHRSGISFTDAIFGVAFVLGWRYCLSTLKLSSSISAIPSRMGAIARGVLIMILPVMLFVSIYHRPALSVRNFVTLAFALFAFEVDRVFVMTYLVDRIAARDPRRAIIVGSGRRAGKAWREIRTRFHSSMAVVGFVDDRDPENMAPEIARRYIGRVDNLGDIMLKQVVDVVLLAMPIQSCYPQMQRAVGIAESIGVPVIYMGDIYSSSINDRGSNEEIFTELAPQQHHYVTRLLVKRVVDIVGSAICLILLAPVMLIIGIAIKLTSPGPAIFRQQRYGYRRRLFTMYKFRTMVEDAEALLSDLEHMNEASGPIFKIRNDPRITRIGKFLRNTSLDELPQFWNVLKGDMSIVGPRPMSVRDVSCFSDATLMRRFSVRGGITGLWQVSGRSHVGFDEWIALDVRYIESWSLRMDLGIICRTIGAVLKRSGAM
jgi:exopolysaccharide biosynthesis polyprenyl glycosylphosphotransferase